MNRNHEPTVKFIDDLVSTETPWSQIAVELNKSPHPTLSGRPWNKGGAFKFYERHKHKLVTHAVPSQAIETVEAELSDVVEIVRSNLPRRIKVKLVAMLLGTAT